MALASFISGGQNNVDYAYFPQVNRLAVRQGKQVTIYDSIGHQVCGFSQQQGAVQELYFTARNVSGFIVSGGFVNRRISCNAPRRHRDRKEARFALCVAAVHCHTF
jgi:hypothetical protein